MQAENLEDILSKRTGLHKGFSSKSENEYIRLDRCSIRVAERMADLNSSGFEDTGEIRSLARSWFSNGEHVVDGTNAACCCCSCFVSARP